MSKRRQLRAAAAVLMATAVTLFWCGGTATAQAEPGYVLVVNGPVTATGPLRNPSCSVSTDFDNTGQEPVTVTVNQTALWLNGPYANHVFKPGWTQFTIAPGDTVTMAVAAGEYSAPFQFRVEGVATKERPVGDGGGRCDSVDGPTTTSAPEPTTEAPTTTSAPTTTTPASTPPSTTAPTTTIPQISAPPPPATTVPATTAPPTTVTFHADPVPPSQGFEGPPTSTVVPAPAPSFPTPSLDLTNTSIAEVPLDPPTTVALTELPFTGQSKSRQISLLVSLAIVCFFAALVLTAASWAVAPV